MEEALTSLLSGVAGGRRYWGRVPQSVTARPYLLMNRVGGDRDYAMDGPSGYVSSRVQIDVYAETYAAAKTTTRAVATVLSGFSGTVVGVEIKAIFIDTERDLPADDAGKVTKLFRISTDIRIHHDE